MSLIAQWLRSAFPVRRLTPTTDDVRNTQELYARVFSTPAGRELVELWVEQIMFANPRSTESNECIRFAAQCAFVEDIVKALDKAENPAKYQQLNFGPLRRIV